MPTYFSLSFQHFAPNDPPFRVRPPRTGESEDDMSTEPKTNANRDNSKKSSGPRTAEGKARSSRNSTVHGLTGKSPILPGEDPADLLDLAERYHADLKPDGAVEEDLVERRAVATYRLRRIARIEVGYFDLRLHYNPMPSSLTKTAGPTRWPLPIISIAANTKSSIGCPAMRAASSATIPAA